MKLLKRKILSLGNSKAIVIPSDFIKQQKPSDGYLIVYVPDEHERKSIGD